MYHPRGLSTRRRVGSAVRPKGTIMPRNTSRTLTSLAPIVAALAISGLLARLTTAGGTGRVCKTKQETKQVQKNECNSVSGFEGPKATCTSSKWLLYQSSCVINQDGGDCEENACNAAVEFFYEPRYLGDSKVIDCANLSGACWTCLTLAGAAGTFPGPHKLAAWAIAVGCGAACNAAGIGDFSACCYNECVESGMPLYLGGGTICPY